MTLATLTLATFLAASSTTAPKETPPAAATTSSAPDLTPGPTGEKKVRFRLGILGGLAMQKTDFELAASYDFLKLGEKLRLAGDLTIAFRGTEITFEPMVGLRVPIGLPKAPKLDLYFEALAGANLTFLRGSTALAIPFRVGAGADYQVASTLGVGFALGLEGGPLLAPGAAPYGAVHFGVLLAWTP